MYKTLSMAPLAAALAFVAPAANAADATVPFTGLVLSTCVLTVGVPGVMATSIDFKALSSTAAGGIPGTVAALATGNGFKVSAIAPTAFTLSPTGGGDNVHFNASYSATGSTSIGNTPGTTPTTLNSGLTNVSVNLNAVKSSGTFNGGAYAAEVIVRCE